MINKLFDLLDEWRNLPAYQLERRADIYFALYLKQIIKLKYKQTIKLIIPEFPIRAGDVVSNHKRPDLPFKIDYVAISENEDNVFLIELKTDQGSRRTKQDIIMCKTKLNNIPIIIDGLFKIYKTTKYKKKYDHLISKLIQVNWIKKEREKLINTSKNCNITIVYIQPRNDKNCLDTISFNEVCLSINENDVLSKRFKESLENWSIDPS